MYQAKRQPTWDTAEVGRTVSSWPLVLAALGAVATSCAETRDLRYEVWHDADACWADEGTERPLRFWYGCADMDIGAARADGACVYFREYCSDMWDDPWLGACSDHPTCCDRTFADGLPPCE